MAKSMPSATIKPFLVHCDAKRLRTAELSNWTGKAVAGPRSELDGVLARDEAANSGVYFLSGTGWQSGYGCFNLTKGADICALRNISSVPSYCYLRSSTPAKTRVFSLHRFS